jgi:hypothetical protein
MAKTDIGWGDAPGLTPAKNGSRWTQASGPDAPSRPDRFQLTLVQGSRVATIRGEVAVQDIVAGDAVVAPCGKAHKVIAITLCTLTRQDLIAAHRLTPVLMRAGALGAGLPQDDLCLHPMTRLCVDMPSTGTATSRATDLVGDGRVMRIFPDGVTYVTLTLAAQGMVQVSGVWLAPATDGSIVPPHVQRQVSPRGGWCRIGDITPDWIPLGEAAVVRTL